MGEKGDRMENIGMKCSVLHVKFISHALLNSPARYFRIRSDMCLNVPVVIVLWNFVNRL
jgi:hypothetical protein